MKKFLKAVGILLAAVLLLLLLALLLLLFVPLRYEVAFRHTEEDTFVRGKVSWLLHLVTARIFYEKPDGKGLAVKIGGFQLIPKKGKKPKPVKKTSPKKTRAEKSAAVPKPKAEEARKKTCGSVEETGIQADRDGKKPYQNGFRRRKYPYLCLNLKNPRKHR